MGAWPSLQARGRSARLPLSGGSWQIRSSPTFITIERRCLNVGVRHRGDLENIRPVSVSDTVLRRAAQAFLGELIGLEEAA